MKPSFDDACFFGGHGVLLIILSSRPVECTALACCRLTLWFVPEGKRQHQAGL